MANPLLDQMSPLLVLDFKLMHGVVPFALRIYPKMHKKGCFSSSLRNSSRSGVSRSSMIGMKLRSNLTPRR
jgi:hypothetical protein